MILLRRYRTRQEAQQGRSSRAKLAGRDIVVFAILRLIENSWTSYAVHPLNVIADRRPIIIARIEANHEHPHGVLDKQ